MALPIIFSLAAAVAAHWSRTPRAAFSTQMALYSVTCVRYLIDGTSLGKLAASAEDAAQDEDDVGVL